MGFVGFHERNHEKIYNWIFWLLIIIILIVLYIIGDVFYHCGFEMKYFTEINGIITTMMTVIGIFIAFTAINIYSIFNSRVDEEKESLLKLKKDFEKILKSLKNDSELMLKSWKRDKDKMIESIQEISSESQKHIDKQTHIIKSNLEDINELRQELLISISINNIITDHILIKDKGTAIGILKERIYFLENKIEETDSVSSKIDLKGKLIEFVKTIYSALNGYYQAPRKEVENQIYQRMLNSLMNKVKEIMKRYKIKFESDLTTI